MTTASLLLQIAPDKARRILEINAAIRQIREAKEDRRKAGYFARYVEKTSKIGFACEPWQIKVCNFLQELPYQTGQRVVIKKPPQAGGSVILSQRLPSYYIGIRPKARVSLITYNESHSKEGSVVTLGIMKSEAHRGFFPDPQSWPPDVVSVQKWSTAARRAERDGQASYSALGLQTGIVGAGSDLYLIDDPYSSPDDAFSDTINAKTWNVWQEGIGPRLAPEDNIVSMAHAWNERDFNAHLLESGGWTEIRIPSICDAEDDFAGRPYIPDAAAISYKEYSLLSDKAKASLEVAALTPRRPLEFLLKLRDGYVNEKGEEVAGLGKATFESLHQGNPKARGGSTFKVEDFKYVDEFERHPDGFFVSYWDLGGSDEVTSDRTVNFLLYKTPSGIYTYIDHRAVRLRKDKRNTFIYNTEKEHRSNWSKVGRILSRVEWQMGTATEVTAELIRQCGEFGLQDDHVTKKIEERAEPLAVQMAVGNVRWLKKPWNTFVQDEFISFPQGKHDDCVSAAAGAYNNAAKFRML